MNVTTIRVSGTLKSGYTFTRTYVAKDYREAQKFKNDVLRVYPEYKVHYNDVVAGSARDAYTQFSDDLDYMTKKGEQRASVSSD